MLVVALAIGGGVAAADLTDVIPAVDRGEDRGDHAAADPTAAAVGEATRAGAGTAVCPVVARGDEPAKLVVIPVTDGSSEVRVLRYGEDGTTSDDPVRVSPDTPMVVSLEPDQAARPVGVRWRGEPVSASWVVGGAPSAAGQCEPYPQPVWQVIGFDTTLESDSTLHLVNPYTIDAVVRVTFATPSGPSALVRTDNVLVGAGEHRALDVTDLEPEQPELAATVEVLAGRVAVQGETRMGTTSEETGPEGRALLPAVATPDAPDDHDDDEALTGRPLAATGARAGDDATSWLVVHNPEDHEASFRLSVTDPDEEAPGLRTETGVPPGGVVRVDLDQLSTATEFAVGIEPVGEARLAATRLTAVTNSAGGQDISAAPLRPPGQGWALAGGGADQGRLTVANLGDATTTLDVDAGEATPDEWDRQLVPGEQAAFELSDLGGSGSVPLRISADRPVVAGLTRREGGTDLSLWSLGGLDIATWDADERPPSRRDPALPGRLAPTVPDEDDDVGAAP